MAHLPEWQRFTDRARKVMLIAQREASQRGGHIVDTHHILLALAGEGGGVGANVLRNLEVPYGRVVNALSGATSESEQRGVFSEMTVGNALPAFTLDAKELLKLAADEASRLRHNYIGTEHLLLGMCMQADSNAVKVLRLMGVDPEIVRADVIDLFGSAE